MNKQNTNIGTYIGSIEDSSFRQINIYESVMGGRLYTMSGFDVEYVIWNSNIIKKDSLQACLDYEIASEKREKR